MKNITKKYPDENPIKLHINPDNLLDDVSEKRHYVAALSGLMLEMLKYLTNDDHIKKLTYFTEVTNFNMTTEFMNEMIYAIVSVFVMFNLEDVLKNDTLLNTRSFYMDIINDAIKQFKESLALE